MEATLINRDIADGVTIHWHGVDVSNAEDGVAGVTQNSVMPGERHVYRFVAEDPGTYWYHSHQISSEQVRKVLFDTFIVEPATESTPGQVDEAIAYRNLAPATAVRLRLINTNTTPLVVNLSGTPFRVAAIDGTEVNAPSELRGIDLRLAGGGRYDLTFTMPNEPVLLGDGDSGVVYSAGESRAVPDVERGPEFDADR